jgi:anti-sigma factor RsiW
MACDAWRDKLDLYVDGELAAPEAAALSAHLRTCADCAADALVKVQLKRSVAIAGKRYQPSAELRSRLEGKIQGAAKPQRSANWWWRLVAIPALAVVVLSVAVSLYMQRENARQQRTFSELTDLHVALLASASPFDVVSSDRHTVKPWFQGKLPFTFNLPELQGSDFTLLGGRVTYLDQSPGAHLIYQIRKHEISVFIFQNRIGQDRGAQAESAPAGPVHTLSFNMDSWTEDGLRYFVVGDVGPGDIEALSKLLRGAR